MFTPEVWWLLMEIELQEVFLDLQHLCSIVAELSTWIFSLYLRTSYSFTVLFYLRSNFHIVDNLSKVVYALSMPMLTWISVDEILLTRYMNWSANFKVLPFNKIVKPITHSWNCHKWEENNLLLQTTERSLRETKI